MEKANARLLEAKHLDPRVSVTGQLRETRKHEKSEPVFSHPSVPAPVVEQALPVAGLHKVLTGNLADVNLFDIIQIIENSKLSGEMNISSSAARGQIFFREGLIIGAKSGLQLGNEALTNFTDAIDGIFEFDKSSKHYDQTIYTLSNTALILDLLRAKDEANYELNTGDLFK